MIADMDKYEPTYSIPVHRLSSSQLIKRMQGVVDENDRLRTYISSIEVLPVKKDWEYRARIEELMIEVSELRATIYCKERGI